MSDSAYAVNSAPAIPVAIPTATVPARHSVLVRVTHWITALCFLALLVSGTEIVISHPRFYWGETGNIWTPPLFKLPIPASRNLGADRLRVRAAGPERLEPVSPFSIGLGRGVDRVALCNLSDYGHLGKTCPGRGTFVADILDRNRQHLRSSGRVRPKPGRITSYSGSLTCS